jgi:hypothetical protein
MDLSAMAMDLSAILGVIYGPECNDYGLECNRHAKKGSLGSEYKQVMKNKKNGRVNKILIRVS